MTSLSLMGKNRISWLIFALGMFLTFSGCSIPGDPSISSGFTHDPGSNWFTFFSDDSNDYGTASIYILEESDQTPFTELEVKIKKNRGYDYSDYGMVFCSSASSYLGFVIDTQGNYRIFKVENSNLTTIQDWTFSSALVQGYESENVLKVVQSSNGIFEASINDVQVISFTENTLNSGKSGFFVYVASENYESLDTYPVEVMFEKL